MPRLLLITTLLFICIFPAPADEIRAIWVTRWDYTTPGEVTTILDNIAAHGFNTVLFQVRGNGTTFYPSALEPWAWELSGSDPSTLGTDPGWNPLALAVSHGHGLGLEIHAYMNTYPGWRGTTPPPSGTSPEQLWNAHPDWFCVDSGGIPMGLSSGYVVLSPGIVAVQEYLADIYEEVVTNFDVDGIHFDYVRYYGSEYSWDTESLTRFATEYPGATPATHPTEWSQWRRDQVTALVASVEAETHASKPTCQVTAATWQLYSSGSTTYGQDSYGWLASGILDVSHPMIYTTSVSTHRSRAEAHILNAADRQVSAGIGAYMLSDADTLLAQVQNTRDLGTHGVTIFAYSTLFPGHSPNAMAAAMVDGPFQFPDNPPPLRWLTASGDDDNTGPRIFNVRTDPSTPSQGSPFHVLADVTDISGVFDDGTGAEGQGMHLRWALDADPAGGTVVTMSHQSGDTFITDAPLTVAGEGTIHLQVTAFDDDSDAGTSDHASRETAIHSFTLGDAPIYVYDATVGPIMNLPQYAVMDPQGMIWVCEYGGDQIRIFDQSGNPASFDPITVGLNQSDVATVTDAPSGIACAPDGTIFVTIDDNYDAPLWSGILRFNSVTGAPMTGKNLSFRPGDCDFDSDGNLIVVDKVNDAWHLFTAASGYLSDYVFGSGIGTHINRGIACTDGGERVFVACQEEAAIHTWTRTSTSPPAFSQGANLTSVGGESGAVDVDAQGWTFAADFDNSTVLLFDETDTLIQTIGGSGLDSPRGVGHTPSSDFIFLVPFTGSGQVQRWRRSSPVPAGLVLLGNE